MSEHVGAEALSESSPMKSNSLREQITFNSKVGELSNDILTVLKLAYARGHDCDSQLCPGCEAGYLLDRLTGKTWTQEECERETEGLNARVANLTHNLDFAIKLIGSANSERDLLKGEIAELKRKISDEKPALLSELEARIEKAETERDSLRKKFSVERKAKEALLFALERYLGYNGDATGEVDTSQWDSPSEHPVMIARAAINAAMQKEVA